MSKSRSNHGNQEGMAVVAIVVLFLFIAVGGVAWMLARADRARRVEEMVRTYEAEAQRQRAEAEQAALDAAKTQIKESSPPDSSGSEALADEPQVSSSSIAQVAESLAPTATKPDLAKIERTIQREPNYQHEPSYCLLVFGPRG
jgi:hypothetical protein